VLIPNDTSQALEYITDKEVRKIACVKATNKYMFASKGLSFAEYN
jgi:diacylglycerol kinase family enzyme